MVAGGRGYAPWARERYERLYGPAADAFFDCMDRPLEPAVRFNTLRTDARSVCTRFDEAGISYTPLGGVGARIRHAPFALSSMPEHLMGHFYLQGAAEMAVAPQLSPGRDTVVWDMCAAPGGKTTHLSQLMENTGVIIATDVAEAKISALQNNVARLGCTNTVVLRHDARTFSPGTVPDAVLLDAPCTGSGTIRKDPTRKASRTFEDVVFMQGVQKGLLAAAVRALRPGGRVLYATCSLEPEENECVAHWALESLPVEIVPLAPSFVTIAPGFTRPLGMRLSEKVALAGRVHPHESDTSGMFMALFRKRDGTGPSTTKPSHRRP